MSFNYQILMKSVKKDSMVRIYLYARQIILTNYVIWLIGFSVFLGIGLLIAMGHTFKNVNEQFTSKNFYYLLYNNNLVFYLSGLFLLGTIISSITFNESTSKSKSIFFQLLPCSLHEKYLCKIFITIPFFILFYTCLYFVYSIILNGYIKSKVGFDMGLFVPLLTNKTFFFFFEIYLFINAFFILGSLFFNKNAYIKTVFSLFILIIIFIGLMKIIDLLLFKDIEMVENLILNIILDRNCINIDLSFSSNVKIWYNVIFIFVIIILYYAAFIKIKEKQL